jgi:hypothetical protein
MSHKYRGYRTQICKREELFLREPLDCAVGLAETLIVESEQFIDTGNA